MDFQGAQALTHKLETIVDEHRRCSEGFAILGQVYLEQGRIGEAFNSFDSAIAIAPNNANFRVHKGWG